MQRKFQEVADKSDQVRQLEALQNTINASPHVKQAVQFQKMTNSPDPKETVVQRIDVKERERHFDQEEAAKLEGLESMGALDGYESVHVNAANGMKDDTKKMDALQGGMDVVSDLGYEIPNIDVHFAQDGETEVRNVAFMGGETEDTNNLYMSSNKLLAHSKALKGSEEQIKGGTRDAKAKGNGVINSGLRGIADQIGDGARTNKDFFNRGRKNDELVNKAFAKAVVVHEMGHILHKTQSPDIFWKMKDPKKVSEFKGWISLAMDVSEYATMNPLEYVAEVFTGTSLGIVYNDTIMSKYAEFGGPSPQKGSEAQDAPIAHLDQQPRAHSPEPLGE